LVLPYNIVHPGARISRLCRERYLENVVVRGRAIKKLET